MDDNVFKNYSKDSLVTYWFLVRMTTNSNQLEYLLQVFEELNISSGSCSNINANSLAGDISRLRECMDSFRAYYSGKVSGDLQLSSNYLQQVYSKFNKIVGHEENGLYQTIRDARIQCENDILTIVMKYHALLVDEMSNVINKLKEEKKFIKSKINANKFRTRMKLFSKCLELESNGKV